MTYRTPPNVIPDYSMDEEYATSAAFVREVEGWLENNEKETLRDAANELHAADMAELLIQLSQEHRREVVEIIKADFDPEIITYLDLELREEVLEVIGTQKAAEALAQLEGDDAFEVIHDLDDDDQKELLEAMPEAQRAELVERLAYPEHSAGRMMNRKVVAVPQFWTVGDTIDFLRKDENLPLDFYEIFVVDPKHRPIGGIVLSRIMISQRTTPVQDIMESDISVLETHLDQEEAAHIFRKYGLVSAPVVNDAGRLVGVITVDDIVHVISEEAQEDLMRMGGVSMRDVYSDAIRSAGRRFPWLFVNLVTAFITSLMIGFFEHSIAHLVALAALMPMVASMGGNAGTQSVTLAVRALATKELTEANFLRVMGKEILVCLTNGLLLAVITSIAVWLRYGQLQLCLVFGLSLVLNFVLAGLFGALIPYTVYKLKGDPAIASGVFLTALTDIGGFVIFLGLATLWLM